MCICPYLVRKGRESINVPKCATDFAAVARGWESLRSGGRVCWVCVVLVCWLFFQIGHLM